MTKKQKRILRRILLSAALWIVAACLPTEGIVRLLSFLVPYAVIGWDVLWRALRNIAHGQIFDENFLMVLATVGAFCLGEYPEGVAVMLFYQVGELFQSYAVGRSRKSIAALMDIRPDYANLETDGELKQVDPSEIAVGDIIVVKAGEKIPLDGVVVSGISAVNTAALTGESLPRDVCTGDDVISGCINQSGLLRIRVSRAYEDSTVAKILDLVENAAEKKSKSENFITAFARYYTPAVVCGAVLLSVVPPLVLGGGWSIWIRRALTFLVISCPCALVISVPLSFFGGIGGASKCGILIKGSNYLEALARTELMVFDKTGTLTHGTFCVTAVHPSDGNAQQLLELAALAEHYSDHPIAKSLRDACEETPNPDRISDIREIAGRGVRAVIDGREVAVGNDKLMRECGISLRPCHRIGTMVHIAIDEQYAGHIVIADTLKSDAADALRTLKKQGIRQTVILTGDTKEVGEQVARQLEADAVHAELMPADKVALVETLLREKSARGKLAFVGDGINDAPVLSRADIGIAMGALGSDAAIEAADVVLMNDNPSDIALAMRIARKTMRIVYQNIVFALSIKLFVLLLGALGTATMWEAVFADVGVSVIAILNAMRALHVNTPTKQLYLIESQG